MIKNLKSFLLLLMAGMFGMLLTVSCGADDVLSDVEDAIGTDEPVPADSTGNTVATRNIVERMLSLNAETTAVLKGSWTDYPTGEFTEEYTEYYKGVLVDRTRCVVGYDKSGGAKIYANNFVKIDYNLDTTPTVTEAEALQAALDAIGAEEYAWENPKWRDDPVIPVKYPEGALLIYVSSYDETDMKVSEAYLAYKFGIVTSKPEWSYFVYVDAHSGKVIKKLDADIVG